MIEWAFTIIIISYCLFILYLWLGWERIKIVSNEEQRPSVTVVIPVRNEASNIEWLIKDLQNQSYEGHYEVFIVDDHSEDDSTGLISELIKNNSRCKLIPLVSREGKKAAISEGINNSQADIILTTDGDCRVPNSWVKTMTSSFSEDTKFVSGPVKFSDDGSLFGKLQAIEFASLIGSGASLIGWGKPVMANGANMAFQRNAFLAVNGFEGNEDTASGDDVFLLHKIAKQYASSIVFAKQEAAIVQTMAQPSINTFVQQRVRWASKWQAYSDSFTKGTAFLVFVVALSIVIIPFMIGYQRASLFLWLKLLVIKSFFDFFFIRQVSTLLKEKVSLIPFLILQIIYPFYVVFTALFSFQKSYHWKGRKVK